METVGPYRLDALVGRGTTGSVWQATRLGALAHVVAVKRARTTVDPGQADRLRREAAILAELDHPHIVRVIDVLDDGAGVAIVMSLARGGSLHDLLVERSRLTPGQTVAVLSRIADALGSAHRRGVLHGDVKPANILFTSDGEPLLGDFGVAQHLAGGIPALLGEDRSAIEGTTGYVDPELVATGVPEPRGDVYGLGVVAYLCLAGRLPHTGSDSQAVLAAADAGDHPPLADVPGVPAALATVVEAALARDPAGRPATAEALAQALRAAVPADEIVLPGTPLGAHEHDDEDDDRDEPEHELEHDHDRAEPGGTVPRGTRAFGPRPERAGQEARRTHPVLTLAAVVLVLAAAVGGGLWVRDRLDERQAPGDVEVAGGGPPDAVACPTIEPIDVPPGAEELEGDLNGDGCPVQVVWNGQVMRFRLDQGDVEPRSYDFRQAGDRTPGQLLLGDWDCDGRDTPALYRPATGIVAYFDTVPGRVGGEVTSSPDPTGITGGRAVLEPGSGDACDAVEVTPEA